MADLGECDDTCEPDVGDDGREPYLYSLECPGCGLQRATSHCPHDGVQTPCPECRWMPPGTVSPLQALGIRPVVVEPAQGLPGSLPEWVTRPAYLGVHTEVPTPEEGHEASGSGYARVNVGAPMDWAAVPPRVVTFRAPEPGEALYACVHDGASGGPGQWLDLRTSPPTPCDPPPGWVDVDEDEG